MGEIIGMTWSDYKDNLRKNMSKRSVVLLEKVYNHLSILKLIDGTEDIYPIDKDEVQLSFEQILAEKELKEIEEVATSIIQPTLKKNDIFKIDKKSVIIVSVRDKATNKTPKNDSKVLNERSKIIIKYFEDGNSIFEDQVEVYCMGQDLIELAFFQTLSYDQFNNIKEKINALICDNVNPDTEEIVLDITTLITFKIK